MLFPPRFGDYNGRTSVGVKPQASFEAKTMKRLLPLIVLLIATPAFAQIKDAPLPARVAAMKMTLPDGFKATLFAGEPDVVQPIAFCFDDRGRLWVAECLSYPNWDADPKKGKDRILILEDTDGDGVHDKRTVFADNIANISGIQYGFGGVWVCATPNLLFIPIKNDKPAGPPQIVLDGWDIKAKHNVFNSPTWGPDGWLYGCNGILSNSLVGSPGTAVPGRVRMNCGVWRYHPTKKKFEVVAHGTTNPWGLDFDEHGEMFITNCVIDHLWHIVPGGHYQRMFGNDLNPHVYKLMPSICDHIHWGGGSWTSSRRPSPQRGRGDGGEGAGLDAYKVHSEAGGGHAHVGCMIYLGDNWPQRYRGGVFMCNLHGNRINHDILERNGSTYVARHAKDFMHANDPWFRGLAIHYGPDGGVYVSDWTDTGECHNYQVADKTNGRIFKITYGKPQPRAFDLEKFPDLDLAMAQEHVNQWQARHARRLLQERAAMRKIDPKAIRRLEMRLEVNDDIGWRRFEDLAVNALLTLHAISAISDKQFAKLCEHPSEHIRAWAVRLAFDGLSGVERFDERSHLLLKMAERDPSSRVRLYLASEVIRTHSFRAAGSSLQNLLRRGEDSNDPYLPLMYWHAILKTGFNVTTHELLRESRIPLTRQFIARYCTERRGAGEGRELEEAERRYKELYTELDSFDNPTMQRDILRGIQDGLTGHRKLPMEPRWKFGYPILIESPLPEVRERALALAVQFGDERAFTLLRKIVPDRAQPVRQREDALKTLLFQQKPDLLPILHELLSDEALRGPAIRGLAAFEHAETPKLLIQGYAQWTADEKSDALQTLASRGPFAVALLDAIDAKAIPRGDINSYTIRQLQTLKHPDLAAKLAKVWGEVRPASADKARLMAKYKAELTPNVIKKANLSNGRALYAKACASCHRLFGEGGDLGPDLTGSQRMNLDYVLENVLDPSAIVPREYQVTVVETKNGRTLSGMVRKETDAALTLQMPNEQVVIPKADIESRSATKLSMMPDGAFDQWRLEEVRDLVAYLASPMQVALKK